MNTKGCELIHVVNSIKILQGVWQKNIHHGVQFGKKNDKNRIG